MGGYILRRLLVALPTLFVATLIVSGLPRLTDFPDDISCPSSPPVRAKPALAVARTPAGAVIASSATPSFCTPLKSSDELRAELGLDKSFPQSYP